MDGKNSPSEPPSRNPMVRGHRLRPEAQNQPDITGRNPWPAGHRVSLLMARELFKHTILNNRMQVPTIEAKNTSADEPGGTKRLTCLI
ncbi:hypothetical protein M8C21_009472 [Ambrosia artemisiifolia]|uniref:Uncharacterized protein n=1 Tax=Ambrosia artemisiifolia TaxID=4212 RepID=A0AAD5D7G5_AMBAR|nr:hypothetical protein M8C21_009472 [Ambrosia artemisiifolia]